MDTIARETIRTLLAVRAEPCLSLFAPMERAGNETRQNPIRFKNMLREADTQLRAYGLETAARETLLQPLASLLDDERFWQEQADGLAIFRTPEMQHLYRLSLPFDELVVVGPHLHLKPLLPLFSEHGDFYLLALSQNSVRLFHGTRETLDEVELPPETPRTMAEALAADDPESQLQFHTPGGASGAPIYHGHADADERANRLRYFLDVNRGVQAVLAEQTAPLVLAGVEELLPLYRDRNTYPHLLDAAMTGNPDAAKLDKLHAEAWELVQPAFRQARQRAAEQYHEYAAAGRASSDIAAIVPAALYGRVATLFVAVGEQQWGRFDPHEQTVQVRSEMQPGDEDLLNLAALHTVVNSGQVYAVRPDEVPAEDSLLAAMLRY